MKVRAALPADIPAMLELESEAPTAAHWTKENYRDLFSSPRITLVLEDTILEVNALEDEFESGSKLLGFIVARDLGEELEIENVVVAAKARRRGLGNRLMGELIDLAKARGAKHMLLEVRESNTVARRFYERRAFLPCGRRERYYDHPEEAAILYRADLER